MADQKVNPQPIGNSRRFRVLEAYGFACGYCGAKAKDGAILEVDHIHPRSKGGTDALHNLVSACFNCNRGKSARVLIAKPDQRLIPPVARKIPKPKLVVIRQRPEKKLRAHKPPPYMDFADRLWRGHCESCGGDSADPEFGDVIGCLVDGLCRFCNPKSFRSRDAQGQFDLHPVIQRFGDWAVTEYGIECTVRYYPIARKRIGEPDWVSHVRQKGWDWRGLRDAIDFVRSGSALTAPSPCASRQQAHASSAATSP